MGAATSMCSAPRAPPHSAPRTRRSSTGQKSKTCGNSCGSGTAYPQPPQGSRARPGVPEQWWARGGIGSKRSSDYGG
eukprot:2337606-Pyramimonas_sp.AAC.1